MRMARRALLEMMETRDQPSEGLMRRSVREERLG
jgi:hypothetical protein